MARLHFRFELRRDAKGVQLQKLAKIAEGDATFLANDGEGRRERPASGRLGCR